MVLIWCQLYSEFECHLKHRSTDSQRFWTLLVYINELIRLVWVLRSCIWVKFDASNRGLDLGGLLLPSNFPIWLGLSEYAYLHDFRSWLSGIRPSTKQLLFIYLHVRDVYSERRNLKRKLWRQSMYAKKTMLRLRVRPLDISISSLTERCVAYNSTSS